MLTRMWRKGNPSALLVGMQTGATTVENSMAFPQKFKTELPYEPAIPPLWNISKETQNSNLKDYVHLYVHCSIIYNSQDLETAKVSISR